MTYPGYRGPIGTRSPIFQQPVTPPNLLGLVTDPQERKRRQQMQGVGDTLTQLGIGLMGQGPSLTPQSPLQGLAAGLQGANQMSAQRGQEAQDERRMDMTEQQFGMQQQQFQAEQQKQQKADAYEQARDAELERLIATLPPQQRAAARADKETFWKAYAESMFPKESGPQSAIAKLSEDLKAGRIGKAEYDAAVRKETYIAPRDPERTYRDLTDAQGNVIGQVDDRGKKDYFSNGITITNADGSTTQIGGSPKAASQATQASDLRASMIDDAIQEFDTINFDNVRAPMVVAAEAASGSDVGSALMQKGLNEDEKKLMSNQAKIQEATISAITGAAYSEQQKQNMRAAYVPLVTDELPTRIRKLKDAAKFLKQLNANTGRKNAAPAAPAPKPAQGPTVAPSTELDPADGWQ